MSDLVTDPVEMPHDVTPVALINSTLQPPVEPPFTPNAPFVMTDQSAPEPAPQTYDTHTTVAGLVTGICGMLAYFHVLVPPMVATILTGVGAIALGYFTNKGRK